MKINRNSAFTLAEILLTLTIIGLVAALTIPGLIQNTQNIATVAGVRRAYSELSQAYISLNEDGDTMDKVWAGAGPLPQIMNKFSTKLNVIKKCGQGTGCFPDVTYINYDNTPWNNINVDAQYGKAMLSDGSVICIRDIANTCNVDNGSGPLNNQCGDIFIDINGFKGPNKVDVDLFLFHATRTGIFPSGINNDWNGCPGWGCASKVLTDGAVNY